MATILSESFAGGIPSGFASTVLGGGSASLTVSYNGGLQAVDLDKGAFNAAWVLDAVGYQQNLRLVIDLEQVTADNGGSSASGVGFTFKVASEAFHHIVAAFTESGLVAAFRGAPGTPMDSSAGDGGSAQPIPSMAGRQLVELSIVRTAWAGIQVQVRVAGQLVFLNQHAYILPGDGVLPGVFIRDSAYRVHSVEAFDDPVAYVPNARRTGAALRLPTAATLAAGPGRVAGGVRRYDAADGGPLRLAGVVDADGTPTTPLRRRVFLLTGDGLRVVRDTWSDPATGAFEFKGLKGQRYMTIARDHTLTWESEVADQLWPVP